MAQILNPDFYIAWYVNPAVLFVEGVIFILLLRNFNLDDSITILITIGLIVGTTHLFHHFSENNIKNKTSKEIEQSIKENNNIQHINIDNKKK